MAHPWRTAKAAVKALRRSKAYLELFLGKAVVTKARQVESFPRLEFREGAVEPFG